MPTVRDLKKRQVRIPAGVKASVERYTAWCETHPDDPQARAFLRARATANRISNAADAKAALDRLYEAIGRSTR